MPGNGSREQNNNWRGGRIVDPRGYVLLRVGTEHHLADVRGYAYEHRIVAEKIIGHQLRDCDRVRHRDHNHSNNDPSNLVIWLRPENDQVTCACGCGGVFLRFDASWRPRKFISGHNTNSNRDPATGRNRKAPHHSEFEAGNG